MTDDQAWEMHHRNESVWRYFIQVDGKISEIAEAETLLWLRENGNKGRLGRWRDGEYPRPFPDGLEKLISP